jgi:hypothetical protein
MPGCKGITTDTRRRAPGSRSTGPAHTPAPATQSAARAPRVDKTRIAKLKAEIERLVDAVATGALAPSSAVRERQQSAEAELARLESDAAVPVVKVTRMVPKVAESYRELVADLPNVLLHDVARARVELRRLLGSEIRLHPSEDRTYLSAELPDVGDRLVQLAVANALNFKERTIASSSSRPALRAEIPRLATAGYSMALADRARSRRTYF